MLAHGWRSYVVGSVSTLAAAGATVCAGMLSAAGLDPYRDLPSNQAARAAAPFWTFVTDHRVFLIGIFTFVAAAPALYNLIYTHRARDRARRCTVERYLQLVKRRQYEAVIDGINRHVRISLFIPHGSGPRRELRCFFRTDKTQPMRSWLMNGDQGFVLRVWKEQATRHVLELVASNPADRERYLKESWADQATLDARSWPGAAMLGVPIMAKPGADPDAILLIEGRSVTLDTEEHEWDADMCAMLLEE